MRYPDEIIEEVREKNDIVDVIGEYVKLKRAGTKRKGITSGICSMSYLRRRLPFIIIN